MYYVKPNTYAFFSGSLPPSPDYISITPDQLYGLTHFTLKWENGQIVPGARPQNCTIPTLKNSDPAPSTPIVSYDDTALTNSINSLTENQSSMTEQINDLAQSNSETNARIDALLTQLEQTPIGDSIPHEETEYEMLKRKLAETDYIACKLIEGVAQRYEYADVLAQRREWRARLNELEGN